MASTSSSPLFSAGQAPEHTPAISLVPAIARAGAVEPEASILRVTHQPSARPAGGLSLQSLTGRLWRGFRRSVAISLFLLGWELAPRLGLAEPAFLPPLSEVLGTAVTLLGNGQLVSHVQASLSRSLVGFALAILYAVPLGLSISHAWKTTTAASATRRVSVGRVQRERGVVMARIRVWRERAFSKNAASARARPGAAAAATASSAAP